MLAHVEDAGHKGLFLSPINRNSSTMLYHLTSAISSCVVQAYQIASWRRPSFHVNANDCDTIRRQCPCLVATLEAAIKTMPPREVGVLTSILRKSVITLAIFIVQRPTSAQLRSFVAELRCMFVSRCPNVDICDVCLGQMAVCIRTAMLQHGEEYSAYMTALGELRNVQTPEQICRAERLNRKVTTSINIATFQVLLPTLHEEYGLRDIVALSRAYRHEDCRHFSELPLPLVRPVEFSVDDTEAEYQTVGERVEPSTFCKPAESITKDTECSICMTEVGRSEQVEDDQPVITGCGHIFHKLCLDKWVNDSAMQASNTCPSCRTVLCEARQRQHESLEYEDGMTADDSSIWSVESAVATPPRRAQIDWIETRIETHRRMIIHQLEGDWSDVDDSSFSSSDSEERLSPRELFEVRSQRVPRFRIVR